MVDDPREAIAKRRRIEAAESTPAAQEARERRETPRALKIVAVLAALLVLLGLAGTTIWFVVLGAVLVVGLLAYFVATMGAASRAPHRPSR